MGELLEAHKGATELVTYRTKDFANPGEMWYWPAAKILKEFPDKSPDGYNDEMDAALLTHFVPMSYPIACKIYKRLVRKRGLKRLKELTGLVRMDCHGITGAKGSWPGASDHGGMSIAQRKRYGDTGVK